MNLGSSTLGLLLTGLAAGVAAGFFGIGGGLVIVPALVYLMGFSQHKATGTSLACLLPPIGLAAVVEYYRQGHVDIKVALIVGTTLFFGSWAGSHYANKLRGPHLSLAFGVFAVLTGLYTIITALRQMKH